MKFGRNSKEHKWGRKGDWNKGEIRKKKNKLTIVGLKIMEENEMAVALSVLQTHVGVRGKANKVRRQGGDNLQIDKNY